MAEPGHIFGVEPGADFPHAFVTGLRERLADKAPEAAGRVTVFVNTARMLRRVTELWCDGTPGFVPRFRLIGALGTDPALAGAAPPIPPLRTRLELARLISRLMAADPQVAPRAAVWDLADSLASLIDEMHGEGVAPDRLRSLDVANHADHWGRALRFVELVLPFFRDGPGRHAEARQRAAVQRLTERWQACPPRDPVIVAGSTGSRGTTALLMRAVARLPAGALVLPGFDFDMPGETWAALDDIATAEDHPQYRFHRILSALGLAPDAVQRWAGRRAPDPARNRLVSLALRPAPVTDRWIAEGPALPSLVEATEKLSLVEAASPRMEAATIAVILRDALDRGLTAALVTPDRTLARQVAAALDRWGIVPDDSAGIPLSQTPPGRLLRQVAALIGLRVQPDGLIALFKHPLAHGNADRGSHLRHTRDLDLHVRRHGPAFPDAASLRRWAGDDAARRDWAAWAADCLHALECPGETAMQDMVALHVAASVLIAGGPGAAGPGGLWDKAAGIEALAAMEELAAEAPNGGTMSAAEYRMLFDRFLAGRTVRDIPGADPRLRIWGTLEARVQGVDRVVLGGLNEGVWPAAAAPDPWLNRPMRIEAGLLLPERQIGLSAHDFQQAIAAPEAILTRAIRTDEAETTPSRWLNRLMNLMSGLPDRYGPKALEAMRSRGRGWMDIASALERPIAAVPRAGRPAPQPPLAIRPRKLPVTRIGTLIRDPYAVYARDILRLYPLDPLRQVPDARMRGTVLHRIMERYASDGSDATAQRRLLRATEAVLAESVAWPATRALWHARIARVADWFAAFERDHAGIPEVLEAEGSMRLAAVDFVLTARPDRIDRMPDGSVHVIDYKTGSPPTAKMQKHFDKQLPLTAAIIEAGGFAGLGDMQVSRITYIGLGSSPKAEVQMVDGGLLDETLEGLVRLIGAYARRDQGYASRRAVPDLRHAGDYDQLARFGEWSQSDPALTQDRVGGDDGQSA